MAENSSISSLILIDETRKQQGSHGLWQVIRSEGKLLQESNTPVLKYLPALQVAVVEIGVKII